MHTTYYDHNYLDRMNTYETKFMIAMICDLFLPKDYQH